MSPQTSSRSASMAHQDKISSLLSVAEKALNEDFPPNIDAAFTAYQQALELDENNADVLDAFGELLANLGETERAVTVLMKSVSVAPDQGPMKYFYLGQMVGGSDALTAYKKCYSLLEGVNDVEKMTATLCAIGELFMTDLCDEDDAETLCQEAFQRAVALSASSIEALNGMATFHRMRLEIEESKKFCLQAFDILDQYMESAEYDSLDEIAPLPLRQRFAENLVELELIEEALAVLSSILEEDEEDIQSWFLTACCHMVAKEKDEADECIKQANRLLKKLKAELPPHLVEHWTKNLNDLTSRLR
jgi:tetratricopeptide (TPR) repeat protein